MSLAIGACATKGPTTAPASSGAQAPATTAPAAAGKTVKLPGLVIDLTQGYVDLNAEVCLLQGALEVIACTKGTKEHESIVVIESRPIHVHTALLLLGANSGHPAMHKPMNVAGGPMIPVPPEGDRVDVSLVITDIDGTPVERPIGDFISRAEDDQGAMMGAKPARRDEEEEKEKFPSTFVFAGSHLVDTEEGTRKYLADDSGDVISISTFGDEVLCLPDIQSQDNGALMWQVDSTYLPKIHSKVILRLRPQKPQAEGNKPKPATPAKPPADTATP